MAINPTIPVIIKLLQRLLSKLPDIARYILNNGREVLIILGIITATGFSIRAAGREITTSLLALWPLITLFLLTLLAREFTMRYFKYKSKQLKYLHKKEQ
jgi:uncharacterized membrane protein